jgi:hypothetical protein
MSNNKRPLPSSETNTSRAKKRAKETREQKLMVAKDVADKALSSHDALPPISETLWTDFRAARTEMMTTTAGNMIRNRIKGMAEKEKVRDFIAFLMPEPGKPFKIKAETYKDIAYQQLHELRNLYAAREKMDTAITALEEGYAHQLTAQFYNEKTGTYNYKFLEMAESQLEALELMENVKKHEKFFSGGEAPITQIVNGTTSKVPLPVNNNDYSGGSGSTMDWE